MKKKNQKVRKELFMQGMTQGDLARLLGYSEPEMSRILTYELAASEQDEFVRKIRESVAADK